MRALVAALLAAAPLVATAHGPLPTTDGGLEQLARNKESMVARLLTDSPLARRVSESSDPQALALYAEAQANFETARGFLAAGDAAGANAGFDAAMQAMHQARKLLPNPLGADENQLRFGGLLKSLESLRRSYRERFQIEVPAGKAVPAAVEGRLAAIDALLDTARQQAAGGRVADGVTSLQAAERMLMDALQEAIGSATVEYRRGGATSEQIYRDELARNQSFVELVPIAVARLQPRPEQVAAMNRQLELNRELRARAEQAAAAHDVAAATGMLQRATEAIEDLLREAGLSIPRDARE
jgi:hypothetical protein